MIINGDLVRLLSEGLSEDPLNFRIHHPSVIYVDKAKNTLVHEHNTALSGHGGGWKLGDSCVSL